MIFAEKTKIGSLPDDEEKNLHGTKTKRVSLFGLFWFSCLQNTLSM
jgi:hypothetical protein